ncbi:4a-hydroxytetrahydrobiopterin dehydratase [Flavobacterium sp. SUN052]|uniref:4a-hydroxytetrahydrobiopterin dehydratase n=1 Tax=Flavobacterium sp. SUN052 TaxID=3002441 RepID=UPI00237DFE63|nr:4a-hydroxytetrahydrobiopterin dehydratase [Flavobacterium sp. SUN052]MEC4003761.1 4a-hydroxytetrahydrobiopterin dehydratase [Flavobacterium sp. SUN052]
MQKLSEIEINENLQKLNHWNHTHNVIEKSFVFKNFDEAMEIINKIASEAKKQNHHPEWTNVYNKLTIKLSTHDVSGISSKDFDLATAIDLIVKQYC